MKRAGRLIESIGDMGNLELAFYKARRGKVAKTEIYGYSRNLRANLRKLQGQIQTGEVEVGAYRYFTIYDPKKRQICAAPFEQRVLHHALMNICHPYFEKAQVAGSYASRVGKGTYAALEQAKCFQQQYSWYAKLDVRQYFDNIDHGVLRTQLGRLFKDKLLLQIFDQLIDSYEVTPGKGVPIGNLTSQYFANHYLSSADHYAKERLGVGGYVRYMDDMVIWGNDKRDLLTTEERFRAYNASQLLLELKPLCLNHSSKGLPFLGYLLHPSQVRLAKRSRKRYVKKLTLYYQYLEEGKWSQETFRQHALPLAAFTFHAHALGFRQKVERAFSGESN